MPVQTGQKVSPMVHVVRVAVIPLLSRITPATHNQRTLTHRPAKGQTFTEGNANVKRALVAACGSKKSSHTRCFSRRYRVACEQWRVSTEPTTQQFFKRSMNLTVVCRSGD
jgi:hypothetical protein